MVQGSGSTELVEVDWAGRPVRIEYQWLGAQDPAAPVVVFLHEGLGSVSLWRDFPLRLREALDCSVLVYSRPGYGRSTPRPPEEKWGVDFMHRQAYEVIPPLLTALGVDELAAAGAPVVLFGHSDGASIALLYAGQHPERVAGVVVMAPHIFVEEISIRSIEQARETYLTTNLKGRLGSHHDDPDSAFWGWNDIWLHPEFLHWNIEPELAGIRCPVLAIQGLDDEYGTLEQIRGIGRHVPDAELVEIPDCRHSPHRDQPDAVLAAVVPFVERVARAGRGDG